MQQITILVTRRRADGSQVKLSISNYYKEDQLSPEQSRLLLDMEQAANKDMSLRVHVSVENI